MMYIYKQIILFASLTLVFHMHFMVSTNTTIPTLINHIDKIML